MVKTKLDFGARAPRSYRESIAGSLKVLRSVTPMVVNCLHGWATLSGELARWRQRGRRAHHESNPIDGGASAIDADKGATQGDEPLEAGGALSNPSVGGVVSNPSVEAQPQVRGPECPRCGDRFPSQESLDEHLAAEHKA